MNLPASRTAVESWRKLAPERRRDIRLLLCALAVAIGLAVAVMLLWVHPRADFWAGFWSNLLASALVAVSVGYYVTGRINKAQDRRADERELHAAKRSVAGLREEVRFELSQYALPDMDRPASVILPSIHGTARLLRTKELSYWRELLPDDQLWKYLAAFQAAYGAFTPIAGAYEMNLTLAVRTFNFTAPPGEPPLNQKEMHRGAVTFCVAMSMPGETPRLDAADTALLAIWHGVQEDEAVQALLPLYREALATINDVAEALRVFLAKEVERQQEGHGSPTSEELGQHVPDAAPPGGPV